MHPVKFQQQRKKKQDYFTSDIPQFAFFWDLRRQFNPSQLKMYSLFKISEFISGLSSFISFYSPGAEFSMSIGSTRKIYLQFG